MKRLVWPSFASGAVAAAVAFTPAEASACGGFFCDAGIPMAVDQTGEDILFVADGQTVEVHIRIQYMGDPANFAWVIPVLSVPTDFRVGSDALFNNIKDGSVPSYGFNPQPDSCQDTADSGSMSTTAGSTSDGTGASGTDGGDPGPTIFVQETVGAFELTVLGDGTVQEVIAWLDDNGYLQDPESEPIMAEYITEGYYFAALKLAGGAGVEELHPIALDFDHAEPCVPLRLTRIAATDDMEVRSYFLGNGRVVPKSYRHVLVNPLKIDWPNQATNYKDVIARAVDADMADGRAFVTEYAGPSTVVARDGIDQPAWDASAFVGLEAVEAPALLLAQNLVECGWDPMSGLDTCAGTNPMADPLIAQFLPVPDGVDPYEFYNNTATYADLIDLTLWDGAAFAAALDERVIAPALHATELLEHNPYLTRMYTIISPNEMLTDPLFHENAELANVDNNRTATQRILCSGDSVWILPDGREVFVPQGGTWPDIGGDKWWEEEVQDTPAQGAEIVLVRNTEAINLALAEYNAMHGWPGPPDLPGTGSGTEGSSGGDTGTSASSDGGGCGCTTTAPTNDAGWALALLGFGLFARRRDH